MNVDILTHEKSISKTRARMAIADCDIHPSPKSVEIEIFPFLSKRWQEYMNCLLYTSPSPRDKTVSRMPSSA